MTEMKAKRAGHSSGPLPGGAYKLTYMRSMPSTARRLQAQIDRCCEDQNSPRKT